MKTITQTKSKHRFYLLLLIILYSLHSPALFAQQQIRVTGTVKDIDAPLPGVTVWEKDTNNGTLTDENGKYSLQITPGSIVTFSFIGYKTQTHIVSGTTLNITLQPDEAVLDEVVINAGYYSVKDRERTGSIARVTAKDIEFQPVINPLQAIQGRMAGVSITQRTGVPGGGFDIEIRGKNSLRHDGNYPLYIVDGVPYMNNSMAQTAMSSSILPGANISPLNAINPSDIESIEILKDADATAIYGSRGANGVVLITTKKGKAGKTSFSIESSTSFSKVANFMKLMNTRQYLQMRGEALKNDGITEIPSYAHDMNGNWDRARYTDWQKELIGGTAQTEMLRMNITGGNENTRFLFSGSHIDESTVFLGNMGYKRNFALMNLNHQSKDNRFKADASVSYSDQHNNLMYKDYTSVALTLAPNAPALYNEDGTLNWQNSTFENPLAQLEAEYKYKVNIFSFNTSFSYKLLSNLFIKLNAGLNHSSFTETNIQPHTTKDPGKGYSSQDSYAKKGISNSYSYIVEPQINWIKTFGKHNLNFLIGATFQDNSNSAMAVSGYGFSSNALIENIGVATTKYIDQSSNLRYKYNALFGRINYMYNDKYLLNITGRRDGSSRFGPANRFGNFGAVGVGWIFSREQFAENSSWLSFGKLRSSYGTTGSDNIGDYQFLDTYTVRGSKYDGKTGLYPSRLYNPDFGWEKTTKTEAAIELGFFKDHINISAAWYKNRSSNQLVGIPLPSTTGFSTVQANLPATVENKGWEFILNTVNLQTKDWNWTTSFNISFPKNKLVSFPDLEASSYANSYVIGKSINLVKLYHYEGIDPQTGMYRFTDYNNDGKFSTPDDTQIIREMGVKYHGGLNNTITYRNWGFDFLFQFVRQTNYNYNNSLILPGATGINQPIEMLDKWTTDNPTASYSFYSTGLNAEAWELQELVNISDRAVGSSSFIRLKNIGLSYRIKLKEVKIEDLLIYFQGQNLLTFTNYFGMDPEMVYPGYLPPLKTYSFGVKLTF